MRAFIYATERDGQTVELPKLIAYARAQLPSALIKGVWLDECDDLTMLRRKGGAELFKRTRKERGDHLIVPNVGTLAHSINVLTETIECLVDRRRLTIHFIDERFVFAWDGNAKRIPRCNAYNAIALPARAATVPQGRSEPHSDPRETEVVAWKPKSQPCPVRFATNANPSTNSAGGAAATTECTTSAGIAPIAICAHGGLVGDGIGSMTPWSASVAIGNRQDS